jgi:hypothetical protein
VKYKLEKLVVGDLTFYVGVGEDGSLKLRLPGAWAVGHLFRPTGAAGTRTVVVLERAR